MFEANQRENDDALKRFLREGLNGTTVTCVLVGAETCLRRWVRYEIFRSFMRGNGLLAIRIHTIGSLRSPPTTSGGNPFECVAFTVVGNTVQFKEIMTTGWQFAIDVGTMPLSDVAYNLLDRTNHTLGTCSRSMIGKLTKAMITWAIGLKALPSTQVARLLGNRYGPPRIFQFSLC